MAAIGKIRQNSGLLLIVIGGAMVAFVLSDMFSAGGGVQEQYVGEIDGNAIDRVVYEQRVQKELESRNSLGQPTSAEMTESIRNTVWNNMVRERVMMPQLKEAGVTVTPEEFDDLTLGDNMLPEFRNDPTFQDPETGQFDKEMVRQYLDFVRTTPQYRTYWELQRQRIINQRMYDKYNNMVSGGLVANSLEAKQNYYGQNRKADLRFVVQPYSAIPDSTVSYDESELKSYYSDIQDEARFKQSETRSFDYIRFNVEPTADDTAAILEYMSEMVPDFEETKRDSVFVVNNSDSRSFSRTVFKPEALQTPEVDEMIMSADSGEVVGPYLEGSDYIIAKVLDVVTEEQARVRHILLSTEGQDKAVVKSRADSLLRVVKRQNNFEEMVQQFSDDPGSVPNGGVYEWFNRERMVPEFTEASFEEKVGAITIAETQFGFHIVEVLGQREEEQRNIIKLNRRIEPSSETFDEVYQVANSFSLNFDSPELFAEGAEQEGYTVETANDISRTANTVGQIQNATELVRWAFSSEKGVVSEPLEMGTNIIIAVVTETKEEGVAPFEDVREIVEEEVITDKKADLLKSQMSDAGSLDDLASALKVTVRTANGVSFNNPVLGGSQEPAVVGKVLTLESGEMSKPLKGKTGVYVVSVESFTDPLEVEEYSSEKNSLTSRMSSRVNTELYNALKEKANVKDERSKFY